MPFDALRQTQPASAKELSDVISAGMMPNSILISGSRGSSRLTGALDLAFYHAGGDRELLKTGNVAYFASRSFRSEFETAANLFRKHMNRRSRLFFIQTVKRSISVFQGPGAIVAVILAHSQINRSSCLGQHLQISIPLCGCSKIRRIKFWAFSHDQ